MVQKGLQDDLRKRLCTNSASFLEARKKASVLRPPVFRNASRTAYSSLRVAAMMPTLAGLIRIPKRRM
jgi:hypothetical protein